MKKEKCNAILIAIGVALVIALCQGSMYSFSVLLMDIIEDTGSTMTKVLLIGSFSTGGTFVANLFVGQVMSKVKSKWVFFIGAMLIPVHYVIYYFSKSMAMLYFAAAISGVAAAFLMAPASVLLSNWFIAKRSTAITCAFGAMNVGGAIFMYLAGQLVTSLGWRNVELVNAAIVLVVSLAVCLLVIKEDPAEIGQKPYGYDQASAMENAGAEDTSGVSAGAAFKSVSFYILFISCIVIVTSAYAFTNLAPTFLTEVGMSIEKASVYTSAYSIVAIFAAVISGLVADKWGTKAFMIYSGVLACVGLVIFSMGSAAGLVVALVVLLLGLADPMGASSAPLLTSACFGMKDYPKLVGFMQGALNLGAAVMVPVIGAISENAGIGLAFKVAALCTVVGVVLALLAIKISPKNKVTE